MENINDLKALYIVVNAGFSDEVIAIARAAGAKGATILNARGEGAVHKSIMGITVDSEKEMVISIVGREVAEKIMAAIKENAGLKSRANGICFVMPVEKMIGINPPALQTQKQE